MAPALLPDPDNSIATTLGVSPGALDHHIPDLRALRESGRNPQQLETTA